MSDDLKDSPVSEYESFNAEDGLAQCEGDLDGDTEESSELEADVFHHEDEGDHEAADAAHPGDEPQQTEPIGAPGASAESSVSFVGKTWSGVEWNTVILIKLSNDKSRVRIELIAASQNKIADNISP